MNHDEHEWNLQAAEYVLGSLDQRDVQVFDQLYLVDEEWREQVHRWRTLLDPLNASTAPVDAPRHVLDAVLAQINSEKPANDEINLQAATPVAARVVSDSTADEPLPLPKAVRNQLNIYKERVRYWQLATMMAVVSAIAVLLLTPHYLQQRGAFDESVRTVAILQGDADELLWAISYTPPDGDTEGSVSITVVGEPELRNDQNHQLWMVLPESEEGVRSVGLMPDTPGQTIRLALPEALDDALEFAVSLEDTGGVEGPEHGPLVARTFIIEPASD